MKMLLWMMGILTILPPILYYARKQMPKKPQLPLLTDEGRKYARYILIGHNVASRIPLIGKYGVGFIMTFVYQQILQEGAKEHARRKRQAQMSKMRNRTGVD